jgi:hypothetical protein
MNTAVELTKSVNNTLAGRSILFWAYAPLPNIKTIMANPVMTAFPSSPPAEINTPAAISIKPARTRFTCEGSTIQGKKCLGKSVFSQRVLQKWGTPKQLLTPEMQAKTPKALVKASKEVVSDERKESMVKGFENACFMGPNEKVFSWIYSYYFTSRGSLLLMNLKDGNEMCCDFENRWLSFLWD